MRKMLCPILQTSCGVVSQCFKVFFLFYFQDIWPFRAFFAMDLFGVTLFGSAWLDSGCSRPYPHNVSSSQSFFFFLVSFQRHILSLLLLGLVIYNYFCYNPTCLFDTIYLYPQPILFLQFRSLFRTYFWGCQGSKPGFNVYEANAIYTKPYP